MNSDGVDKDSDDSDWGFGSKVGTSTLSPPSAVEANEDCVYQQTIGAEAHYF
jgi:hypothetical protein